MARPALGGAPTKCATFFRGVRNPCTCGFAHCPPLPFLSVAQHHRRRSGLRAGQCRADGGMRSPPPEPPLRMRPTHQQRTQPSRWRGLAGAPLCLQHSPRSPSGSVRAAGCALRAPRSTCPSGLPPCQPAGRAPNAQKLPEPAAVAGLERFGQFCRNEHEIVQKRPRFPSGLISPVLPILRCFFVRNCGV